MVSQADILHAKILIVDDQEANVLLLEQMLRAAGYDRVSSTREPTQVCELHLVEKFDLILLDLHMPAMDGFQVMENLKEIETGGYLPVLVITAQPEHKLRALKSGARDFVSKPFDLAEVLLRVHNQVEVRLLHQETRKLYDKVVSEQKVSARLLLDVLPRSVVERLKERPNAAAELVTEGYAEVTMVFADVLAFTKFSEGAGAQVLTGVLAELAAKPEAGARIIGDAWLAAAHLPDTVAHHTVAAAQKALDLRAALERFNDHGRYRLEVRIGLEAGPSLAPVRKGKGKPKGKRRAAEG
ncbi:MAG: response regulator [Archangium sp.]|nr:response regulator [Archangium sp.]